MRNHTGRSHDKTAILTQILKFESWMGSNVRARPLTVFITWKKKHPLLAFLDKRVGQENTRWVGLCCCCSHFNLSNKFCCWSFCIQVAFQWIGNGMPLTHNIHMRNPNMVYVLKMEYVSKISIFDLKIMVKSGIKKIFLKLLHVQSLFQTYWFTS